MRHRCKVYKHWKFKKLWAVKCNICGHLTMKPTWILAFNYAFHHNILDVVE